MAHPIDNILIDGIPPSKADFRIYERQRVRVRILNINSEVRAQDLSDWFGFDWQGVNYNLDINSTAPDDGVTVIIDGVGNRFVAAAAGGGVEATDKVLTVGGASVTIDDDETAGTIGINNTSGGAITVYLPDAAVRKTPIKIVDKAGNAGTNFITVAPKAGSGQTIMTGPSYTMYGNGMGITLTPWTDGTGYH